MSSCFGGDAHQILTDIFSYVFRQVLPIIVPLDGAKGFFSRRVTCFRVIVICLEHIYPGGLGNQELTLVLDVTVLVHLGRGKIRETPVSHGYG